MWALLPYLMAWHHQSHLFRMLLRLHQITIIRRLHNLAMPKPRRLCIPATIPLLFSINHHHHLSSSSSSNLGISNSNHLLSNSSHKRAITMSIYREILRWLNIMVHHLSSKFSHKPVGPICSLRYNKFSNHGINNSHRNNLSMEVIMTQLLREDRLLQCRHSRVRKSLEFCSMVSYLFFVLLDIF